MVNVPVRKYRDVISDTLGIDAEEQDVIALEETRCHQGGEHDESRHEHQ